MCACVNRFFKVIDWCNANQGFLSAILSIITIALSFLAIYFSRKESKKQNKIALFEKRTDLLKQLHELKEFFTWLQLYKNALTGDNLARRKKAIKMISPDEITMKWYYDFQNAKFIVGRSLVSNIDRILNFTDILLKNYRIFKEDTERDNIKKDEIETVFSEIDAIENTINETIKKIEKKIEIKE